MLLLAVLEVLELELESELELLESEREEPELGMSEPGLEVLELELLKPKSLVLGALVPNLKMPYHRH